MGALELLALGAIVLAAAVVVWDRLHLRQTLRRMDAMLDDAIRGGFSEDAFDETLLSAVETKLAHYLSASAVSARNLQSEKDAIKTLIADISHQTKTPVANLLLYAQLLSEQDLPPEGRRCAQALEAQAEKLRFLIEALVKTSRLETGILTLHPKTAPLQPMLESAVDQAAPKAAAKSVTLTLAPTDLTALFDPKWTAEAVGNLLDNAVKYTPPGGSVTVSAVAYDFFCRVDVRDTGIGIPEAEQARVFQRFYRAGDAHEAEGVGIGLYLSRQIAAGQGGYLKVASAPGKGSTFSLFLPRERPPAAGGNAGGGAQTLF